ncbi:glycosyltransferase family 39 protein [Marinilabiliaceae bacterium JC017]|nr:glycosyltransferase family 39 protein [Marinilabiliaceae bacterium JC017]
MQLSRSKQGLMVFMAAFFLMSFNIWGPSIYILDESKNAQCAWEMMTDGNLITPTFNGELRTDKPPLHYYFMMISYSIFGKTALGARFFSAVWGAILMVVLFFFTTRYASIKTAWWTILVLLSSIHFILEFHLAVPDPYLISFIGLSFMSFFHFYSTHKRTFLIPFYLFMGLGVMTKGPIAMALPGLCILLFIILKRNLTWSFIKKLNPLLGLLILSVVIIPWYYMVSLKTDGEWLHSFLLDHNINRFSNQMEGHGGIFLITPAYFIMGFLPFAFFLPQVIKHTWQTRNNDLTLFSALIVLVFVTFFSVSSTKLPNYPMPCFAFGAILFGRYFEALMTQKIKKSFSHSLYALLGLTLLIPLVILIALPFEPLLQHLTWLPLTVITMPISVGIAIYLRRHSNPRNTLISIGGGFMLTSMLLFSIFFTAIDQHTPVSLTLNELISAPHVASYGSLNPAFVFNYGKIHKLTDSIATEDFLASPGNILLTTQKHVKKNPHWTSHQIILECKDIFDNRETVVIKSLSINKLSSNKETH